MLLLLCAADINIFWHPQGDYLAVKVDRFTKTRKSTYTGFELFSIREKGIPMDVSALFGGGFAVAVCAGMHARTPLLHADAGMLGQQQGQAPAA